MRKGSNPITTEYTAIYIIIYLREGGENKERGGQGRGREREREFVVPLICAFIG